jgi:hypothetical protein
MIVILLTLIYICLIICIITSLFNGLFSLLFSFNKSKNNLKYNTIEEAVSYILNEKKINTRDQLDKWCNKTHEKLYLEVEKIAPDAWERSVDPKSCVRFAYQKCLLGYSINK